MADSIPALVFGACLVIGGSCALVWHVRSWRRQQQDAATTDAERNYYRRQFARRVQASGIIVLLGILLPIGDLPLWKDYPGSWACFWIAVLSLTLWLLVLGCRDLLSTRVHSRNAHESLRLLREKQRELEQEVARIKARSHQGRPPGL